MRRGIACFFVAIFGFLIFWAGHGLMEGREGFEKVPGGGRMHSG